MGPGPSDVSARVRAALAAPTLGHLDPRYLEIMDETRRLLRRLFRTENALTLAIPGTGSAGMEACFVNLLEPGDEAIVVINGVFGGRMADIAGRCGATVHRLEIPWGTSVRPEQVAEIVERHPRAKLLALVHAETSTGAWQPLDEISRRVHDAGMLLLVDAVTSLAGMDLRVDEWRIDAVYSGTQKCLSSPPGLSPVSFSPAALEAMDRRSSPVQSWYLDLSLLRQYWGEERVYHHTAPVNMTYALRESLLEVFEEGLEERFERHATLHRELRAGLEALGLAYVPDRSLPMLNAVHVPQGVDEKQVRQRLLGDYGIEIGAGLGPFKGKALRIGLMGSSCTRRHVRLLLAALAEILSSGVVH